MPRNISVWLWQTRPQILLCSSVKKSWLAVIHVASLLSALRVHDGQTCKDTKGSEAAGSACSVIPAGPPDLGSWKQHPLSSCDTCVFIYRETKTCQKSASVPLKNLNLVCHVHQRNTSTLFDFERAGLWSCSGGSPAPSHLDCNSQQLMETFFKKRDRKSTSSKFICWF